MRYWSRLSSICIIALSFASANTAMAATYDLRAAANTTLPVTTSDPGYNFSDMTAVGLPADAFDNHFYFSGWEPTLNPAKYLSLSVTRYGTFFSLSSMTFAVESTDAGPATMVVRSSQDGFASDIDSFTWASAAGDVTNGAFDLSAIGQIKESVELRFYVLTDSGAPERHGFANHEPGGAGAGGADVGRDIEIIPSQQVVSFPIPTMSIWSISILSLLISLLGVLYRRRV